MPRNIGIYPLNGVPEKSTFWGRRDARVVEEARLESV